MALDIAKCGRRTIVLREKATGDVMIRRMSCNQLSCPVCGPVIAARLQLRIKYFSQHERLFFFNTITSKDGIDDLEKTFKKIRKELSSDFTIEGYMRRKKVSYEKALKWYEKKKKKMIDFDIDVELGIYSRKNAIIEVANLKKVYYLGLNVKQKIEFHKKYNHLVDELFPAIHEVNKRDEI
ncbi:helicase, partial [Bacillus thuringiensis]|nr:helicase [Bacillus thuringiensis]